MNRKALGKGLGALIPQRQAEQAVPPPPPAAPAPAGPPRVLLDSIVPSPHQPRKVFDDERLAELAASISARGVIQPLIVRETGQGRFELIAGERRWRAARLAGLAEVPVVVRTAEPDEAMELALIENIQRQDLNPIETALAYQQLIESHGLTHEQAAQRVGKDRTSVTNHLRLLGLPEELRRHVASGALGMGHARAILGIPGAAAQLEAGRSVVSKGLSARETERLAQRLARPHAAKPSGDAPKKDIYINDLESSIRRALGTKVTIRHRGGRGVIELHYYSAGELDRLAGLLRGGGAA